MGDISRGSEIHALMYVIPSKAGRYGEKCKGHDLMDVIRATAHAVT